MRINDIQNENNNLTDALREVRLDPRFDELKGATQMMVKDALGEKPQPTVADLMKWLDGFEDKRMAVYPLESDAPSTAGVYVTLDTFFDNWEP